MTATATPTVDIGTLIVSTPGVVGGRPRVEGTRLRVTDIAIRWQLGDSADDILDHWDNLTPAGVHAALAYYFANKEALDREILLDEIDFEAAAAEHTRHRQGPFPLAEERRAKVVEDHERRAALLRQRLGE